MRCYLQFSTHHTTCSTGLTFLCGAVQCQLSSDHELLRCGYGSLPGTQHRQAVNSNQSLLFTLQRLTSLNQPEALWHSLHCVIIVIRIRRPRSFPQYGTNKDQLRPPMLVPSVSSRSSGCIQALTTMTNTFIEGNISKRNNTASTIIIVYVYLEVYHALTIIHYDLRVFDFCT